MFVHGSILDGQIAQKIRSPREVIHDVQPIGLVLLPRHPELLEKILRFRREPGDFLVCIRQLRFQFTLTLRTPARHSPDEERRGGHRETRGNEIPHQIRIHPSSLHS